MAKYLVKVGDDFVIDAVDVKDVRAVEALAKIDEGRRTSRQQRVLTFSVLGVFFFALVIAGAIGWADGSYDELSAVWSHGGVWAGLVLGRYFRKE